MSAFKGTPGPWVVSSSMLVCTPDGMLVADCIPIGAPTIYVPAREAVRNARLIAAAPELLEALQIARDFAAYAQAEPADLALIDAAIAKAIGEQA